MKEAKLKKIHLSDAEWEKLPVLISRGPIEWQQDTPTKFLCSPGCRNCCGGRFYTVTEYKTLPRHIRVQLTRKGSNGVYEVKEINGRCVFFIPNEERFDLTYGCAIHGHEPMRCKIFPYFPIISRSGIFITSETFCDVYAMDNETKQPYDICFGLGKGNKGIKTRIIKMCRKYLMLLYRDYPAMLKVIMFEKPEKLLSKKYIRLHTHRKYKNYEDAIPELQHQDGLRFGHQMIRSLAGMLLPY